MKRILTATILCLMLLSSLALAQQWQFERMFVRSYTHGVAVAPDGNVWVCQYGVYDSINGKSAYPVRVFHPDGTPVSFSPIHFITAGGQTDTLNVAARGIAVDNDGNILLSQFDRLYKIDYKTGAGIARKVPKAGSSLTNASATSTGDVCIGHVSNGLPIYIFSSDFSSEISKVDTASLQLSRNVIISPDGNDVYHCSVAGIGILHYHSDMGTFGPYTLKDTLAPITFAESICWDRKNPNLLWSSSKLAANGYSANTWYAFDVTNKQVVDSIKWHVGDIDSLGTPRGIAFSVSGDTTYLAGFDGQSIQMFVRKPASVEMVTGTVPEGYALNQNYPNPFNPSTTIEFSIPKAGMTTLVVYDMLGREIATLVNEQMTPGTYKASFNASRLASGTYMYRLMSGSVTLTKKMALVK